MSPPDGRARTRAFARDLRRLMGAVSLLSMVFAGLLGALTTPRVGPYLVMGATIYTGFTDVEPPQAPYPWLGFLLGLALLALGLEMLRRRRRGGWTLAHLGAATLALLPFLHLCLLQQAMAH